jgi:hypothetical protein
VYKEAKPLDLTMDFEDFGVRKWLVHIDVVGLQLL